MTLKQGERLKVNSSRLLRGSTQGSNPIQGVWEVKNVMSDTYKLQKIGVSGRELRGEIVYHSKENVEEEIKEKDIEIKEQGYRELGMNDFRIETVPENSVEEDKIENNLALSQINRRDVVDKEEKNIRKAVSNWFHGNHRWTRSQNVFPEDMPLYFKWFNSREYDAKHDTPDRYLKVEKR